MPDLPKPQKKILKSQPQASPLTLKAVQQGASEPVFLRGVRYFLRNRVVQYNEASPYLIDAKVSGSGSEPYTVQVEILSPEAFHGTCSCPYFEEVCKHSVAVLLNYLQRRDRNLRTVAKEILEQARDQRDEREASTPDPKTFLNTRGLSPAPEPRFQMGFLLLPRPLALILGIMPAQPAGKVNILKIPPIALTTLPEGSPARTLADYLVALPQAITGSAGGHRIPQNQEGPVLDYVRHAVQLVNVMTGELLRFADEAAQVRLRITESKTGELHLVLLAQTGARILEEAVFILGTPSWVLSQGIFYRADTSWLKAIQSQFDSAGTLALRENQVPGFLLRSWPQLKGHPQVEMVTEGVPLPEVMQEDPVVILQLNEKESTRPGVLALVVQLGFRYGSLLVPSETLVQEQDRSYTRFVGAAGESLWVHRLVTQEMQLRQLLQNLQPDRLSGDRFFFSDERGLEALNFLRRYGQDWEILGEEVLTYYRLHPEPLNLKAHLTLEQPRFRVRFTAESSQEQAHLADLLALVARGQSYYRGESGYFSVFPARALDRLLRALDLDFEQPRPLYQVLPLVDALTAEAVEITYDEAFTRFLEQLRNIDEIPVSPLPQGLQGELRTYQVGGVTWLRFLSRFGLGGILADDMGLGKTLQTLTLLLAHHHDNPQAPPTLVIAPTSVVYNWQDEARKFTPQLRTELFLGADRQELLSRREQPQVYFTTYGIVRRDIQQLKDFLFSYVILDEAQNIKNPESISAKSVKLLKSLHTLALSGTPIENRLLELWSIFDFLMPDFLGNVKGFQERYERPISAGDPQVARELQVKIRPFILRRLKTQVEKDLPSKTDILSFCSLNPTQQAVYLKTLEQCRTQIFGEVASHGVGGAQMSILAALLKLRQICCDPRLIQEDQYIPEDSAKLQQLLELLETILEEGHRVLIFSQFVTMLSLIKRALDQNCITYEYLDGGTPALERRERVERFNTNARIQTFLISLKAGGTGLNLTGADYVIHFDPWWNPAVEAQATDRAYRIGQTRPVFNYKLITRGTIEEKVLQLQRDKAELANQMLSTDSVFLKSLSRQDLEFLFS
ncbi:DEAD/DEAH box helicase [Anthocerotibacter panamensis]|uniref:DEAD/DEAH box helicase n=1 Tax=Anthocerotibacter panamensis TaxID=2857077 RepID=UPI001C4075D6|nr:DEAD/DEAH box helicase [Anthocerotibacter panamensis]